MTTTNLFWFAGGCLLILWLMFRMIVRMEEGPPLDTELWLRLAGAALGAFAMACFVFSFVLLLA